jgi:hypothetical protein
MFYKVDYIASLMLVYLIMIIRFRDEITGDKDIFVVLMVLVIEIH